MVAKIFIGYRTQGFNGNWSMWHPITEDVGNVEIIDIQFTRAVTDDQKKELVKQIENWR